MKIYLSIILLVLATSDVKARRADTLKHVSTADSLLNALNTGTNNKVPVIATFKSTWLILSQTTETIKKKNLNFLVVHRFGDIGGVSGGGQTFFGLDASTDIYIGFEYGLTDNLNIDFGRSKNEQLLDLGLKYAILHQTADDKIPIAITLIGKGGLKPYRVTTNVYDHYSNRLSYLAQVVIARKFSSRFSLQITPTYLRDNLPYPIITGNEKQFFALGAAGRFKITKRLGIVVDYNHSFSAFRDNSVTPKFYDPIGAGIEIETGGHVFTIYFTNAQAISQLNYLTDTESSWSKGQFRLGFTISRIFDLNPKHKNNYK